MSDAEVIAALEAKLIKMDADHAARRDALIATIGFVRELFSPTSVTTTTSSSTATTTPRTTTPQRPQSGSVAYGGVTKVVREVVLSMDGEFTKDDVERKLRETSPAIAARINGNIPSYMWRFNAREKIIRQTQESNGREPAKYVKI